MQHPSLSNFLFIINLSSTIMPVPEIYDEAFEAFLFSVSPFRIFSDIWYCWHIIKDLCLSIKVLPVPICAPQSRNAGCSVIRRTFCVYDNLNISVHGHAFRFLGNEYSACITNNIFTNRCTLINKKLFIIFSPLAGIFIYWSFTKSLRRDIPIFLFPVHYHIDYRSGAVNFPYIQSVRIDKVDRIVQAEDTDWRQDICQPSGRLNSSVR